MEEVGGGSEHSVNFYLTWQEVGGAWSAHLDHARDEEGEHGEGEAEDVEEGESDESLAGGELLSWVVEVDQGVGEKGREGDLGGV